MQGYLDAKYVIIATLAPISLQEQSHSTIGQMGHRHQARTLEPLSFPLQTLERVVSALVIEFIWVCEKLRARGS